MRMRWDLLENRLVAEQTQILKPSSTTAMKTAAAAGKSEVAEKGK
jgi:hypothetical protein